MTKTQFHRWARLRSGGKWRYILINGVLYWGVLTAVLWSGAMAWLGVLDGGTFLGTLRFAVPIFGIGGILFGLLTWSVSEKAYAKARDEMENDA